MSDVPHITQAAGRELLTSPLTDMGKPQAFRKKARILAVQMWVPFTVDTDRGVMTGASYDWLVTNHPEDDPGSDVWSISDERMRNTYEAAE